MTCLYLWVENKEDDQSWWITIRTKIHWKQKEWIPQKPITAQSSEISQWQKGKCCQASAPYLSEWNLQRYTVPLRAACSLCAAVIFFFSQLLFQMCLADKSVSSGMHSMSSHTEAGCWPPLTPGHRNEGETESVFEILTCSHLVRFVIAFNPTQPSYTSVSVTHPPASFLSDKQPSAKTHQGHGSCTAHELKIWWQWHVATERALLLTCPSLCCSRSVIHFCQSPATSPWRQRWISADHAGLWISVYLTYFRLCFWHTSISLISKDSRVRALVGINRSQDEQIRQSKLKPFQKTEDIRHVQFWK